MVSQRGRGEEGGSAPEDPGAGDAGGGVDGGEEEGGQAAAALAHGAQRDQAAEQVEADRQQEAQEGPVALPHHALLARRDLRGVTPTCVRLIRPLSLARHKTHACA